MTFWLCMFLLFALMAAVLWLFVSSTNYDKNPETVECFVDDLIGSNLTGRNEPQDAGSWSGS